MPRVLLLLPTTSWRAEAMLEACRHLGVEATVGTDRPLVWAERTPERVISLDFTRPGEAAEQEQVEPERDTRAGHRLPGREPAQEQGEPTHGDVEGLALELSAHARPRTRTPVVRSQAAVRAIPSAKGVIRYPSSRSAREDE